MRYFLLFFCFYGSYCFSQNNVALSIDRHLLKEDTLTLYYSIKNNSNESFAVVLSDISTFTGISTLTLLIFENDTIQLHISNPFPENWNPTYRVITPNNYISKKITIHLNELCFKENIFYGPNHKISWPCSFQLIYHDLYINKQRSEKIKAYDGKKRIKKYIPVSDTLQSNIIYIDKLNFN